MHETETRSESVGRSGGSVAVVFLGTVTAGAFATGGALLHAAAKHRERMIKNLLNCIST